MATVYQTTAAAIDDLVSTLVQGVAVNQPAGSTPTLLNIIAGGGWVVSDSITAPGVSLADLQDLLRKDLMQRGINHLWSKSKIYVTFANLDDDSSGNKCVADKNGWQASKVCSDNGVYYLYFFKEGDDETGQLWYPWGADQMASPPWNLDPSVRIPTRPPHPSPKPTTNIIPSQVGHPLLRPRLPRPKRRRRRLRLRLHPRPKQPPGPANRSQRNRHARQPARHRRRLQHLRLRHGHPQRLERRFHPENHDHDQQHVQLRQPIQLARLLLPLLLRAGVHANSGIYTQFEHGEFPHDFRYVCAADE